MATITRDADPQETQEWLEALEAVLREDGPERAQQLIDTVVWEARDELSKKTVKFSYTLTVIDAAGK